MRNSYYEPTSSSYDWLAEEEEVEEEVESNRDSQVNWLSLRPQVDWLACEEEEEEEKEGREDSAVDTMRWIVKQCLC